MSSNVDFDALPYDQRLQAILRSQYPPDVLNLGKYSIASDGNLVEQADFVPMTRQQLQQLAHLLHTQPSVTHLNLSRNKIGSDGWRDIAASIALNTRLKTLHLKGTCCCDAGACLFVAGEGGRERVF